MRIGVPKESKAQEYRVGLTPESVFELVTNGAEVIVEHDAGAGIDFEDADYRQAGAEVGSAEDAFVADLIVKVKEPNLAECRRLGPHQTLFTYLHLAADRPQAEALMASGATAIAYETVSAANGGLPLLRPMSEVAGRMSVQVGASALQKAAGGRGVLLGGVPGTAPARVVVIGGGSAGAQAILMAVGLAADVTVLDNNRDRLCTLAERFGNRIRALMSTPGTLHRALLDADLVIGAVLAPGDKTPKLVSCETVQAMRPGSVLVDIAIDQGGCFETSRPTTHDRPTYLKHGVVHYCVANMPGAVPRTATLALNNVTLPYVHALARLGRRKAFERDPGFAQGLNVHKGRICHPAVARALGHCNARTAA